MLHPDAAQNKILTRISFVAGLNSSSLQTWHAQCPKTIIKLQYISRLNVFQRRCDICREFCPTHNNREPSFEIGCISINVINECNFSKCQCMNIQTKKLYALLYNSNIILQEQKYSVQLRDYLSGLDSFRSYSYCLWQCELWYMVTE